MKGLWNSFKIAFSMYSKIPMPKSDWTKENMKYTMAFFPWIGIVIGLLSWGWLWLADFLTQKNVELSHGFVTVVLLLIPVVITGGIHLDGLLDTADARSSWQERERRLEILKDSHAGAFAIIACAVYFIFSYGVYTMADRKNILLIIPGFVLSRTLSGLAIVTFPMAKGTGLAATFSENSSKKRVRNIMFVYLLILAAGYLWIGGVCGAVCLAAAGLMFAYYYHMSLSVFGGITGDLAGYFLQMCELVTTLAAVLSMRVF